MSDAIVKVIPVRFAAAQLALLEEFAGDETLASVIRDAAVTYAARKLGKVAPVVEIKRGRPAANPTDAELDALEKKNKTKSTRKARTSKAGGAKSKAPKARKAPANSKRNASKAKSATKPSAKPKAKVKSAKAQPVKKAARKSSKKAKRKSARSAKG